MALLATLSLVSWYWIFRKSFQIRQARTETDTFGPIEVASDRYWGAQAQRSLGNFKIGWEKQPLPIVRALGIVKRAAAETNMALGKLDPAIEELQPTIAELRDEAWALDIRNQCEEWGVPFFFKQWGTWGADNKKRSKKANGRTFAGRQWDEMPAIGAAA